MNEYSKFPKWGLFIKLRGFLHKPENNMRGFLHKPQNRVRDFLLRRLLRGLLLRGFLLRAHFVRGFLQNCKVFTCIMCPNEDYFLLICHKNPYFKTFCKENVHNQSFPKHVLTTKMANKIWYTKSGQVT